jgi:hypothetical protein
VQREALPPGVPPEAVDFLNEMGYLEADRLQVGGLAPDVPLLPVGGELLRTPELWRERSVVFIFGSYT